MRRNWWTLFTDGKRILSGAFRRVVISMTDGIAGQLTFANPRFSRAHMRDESSVAVGSDEQMSTLTKTA